MIRAYAFAAELHELPERSGVAGATLERWDVGDADAVVSRHTVVPDGDPRQDALAHGLVVEALVPLAPALVPVRFGELFPDEASFVAASRARAERLRRALERVRGCVEVGVRVTLDGPRPAPATRTATGTAYLAARLADVTRTAELDRRLEQIARAWTSSVDGARSYLVERGRVTEVRDCVEGFGVSRDDVTVLCTGPWAPYSFVGDWS